MAGDIKQIFTVDLDLVLGQLSGEKLDKQAKAEAQKSINELTRLLSQAAIEPEIPIKAKVKVDGADLAKSLNPSQIVSELKKRLSNPKFQKDPNLNKAIDKYFGDLAASFETVSTASFDKKVSKLFGQVKSGNKKFEELNAREQEQLVLYRAALNDRLKLLRDVKSASNRINRQIRAGDGEETFDLPAFILPQLTQGIAEYGKTLKAFDKLTGLEQQLRNKASAAERGFAQANIAKITQAGGIDKIKRGFPFRRVDKAYQTLIRDQEANLKATTDLKDKENIQRAIDRLNNDREQLSVRRREILGSTLATSLENKQKTVDANLRMANELRGSRSAAEMAPEERAAYGKYLSTAVSSANQIQQKLANTADEAKAKDNFIKVQKNLLSYRDELKKLGRSFDDAGAHVDLFRERQAALVQGRTRFNAAQSKSLEFARRLATGMTSSDTDGRGESLSRLKDYYTRMEAETRAAESRGRTLEREAEARNRRDEQRLRKERDAAGQRAIYEVGRDNYSRVSGRVTALDKADYEPTLAYVTDRIKELKAQQREVGANAAMSSDARKSQIRSMAPEIAELTKAQKILRAEMTGNIGKMHQLSMATKAFLRYFVLYGSGYNIVAYFQNLGKTLIDFKDQLKEIQVVAEASTGEISAIGNSIRSVAAESGASLKEVATAAETLAQAGTAVQNIPAALKAVSDFAMATGSSLQTSSDIITSAKEIFGENLTFTGAADQLTRAVNVSKLKAEDLKTIFNLGAQTAQTSGLTSAQFLGAAATLSNVGIKSSTVATGLRQLLLELFNPDDKTIAFLRRRYNELGERLTDEQIKTNFQAFQRSDNPLLGVLTELRRLGVAGSARDEFRRVLDIRAENVGVPLVERLGDFTRNTARISETGAAAAGAADRVDTLSKAFDAMVVKVQLLAETLTGPALDSLKGFVQTVGEVVDDIRGYRSSLNREGKTNDINKDSALGGGLIAQAIAQRMGLGPLGRTVVGLIGGAVGPAVGNTAAAEQGNLSKLSEKALGKDIVPEKLGEATGTILKIVGIWLTFGGILKTFWEKGGKVLDKGGKALGIVSATIGPIEKSLAGGVLSRLVGIGAQIAVLLSRANPFAMAVTGLYAIYEALNFVQKEFEDQPSIDLDTIKNDISRQQGEVDKIRDSNKNYDASIKGSIQNQAEEARASLNAYNQYLSDFFGTKSKEAADVLAALGDTPIESGSPQAKHIQAKLEEIAKRPIGQREMADLSRVHAKFVAAQSTVFTQAQSMLQQAADLGSKAKDSLTESDKKFLAAVASMQEGPLFKPETFRPEDLVTGLENLFQLLQLKIDEGSQQLANAQAELNSSQQVLYKEEIARAYGPQGTAESQNAFNARVLQIRQTPDLENLVYLQSARAELAKLLEEYKASPERKAVPGKPFNPEAAKAIDDRIALIEAELKTIDDALVTGSNSRVQADQRKAQDDKAKAEQDKKNIQRKEDLAKEAESAEDRYVKLQNTYNDALEERARQEKEIAVLKKNKEYDKLLASGGPLDRQYKAALEVAQADEEMAAAKLRAAAYELGIDLPKGVGKVSDADMKVLNRTDSTRNLLEGYMDKSRKVKEVTLDYQKQREIVTEESLKPIKFTQDNAYRERLNQIEDIEGKLRVVDKLSLEEEIKLTEEKYRLRRENIQQEIDFLKTQEPAYKRDPADQAEYKAKMDDLTDSLRKLDREEKDGVARLDKETEKRRLESEYRSLEVERKRLRAVLRRLGQAGGTLRQQTLNLQGLVPPAVNYDTVSNLGPTPYDNLFASTESRYSKIPQGLLKAIAKTESNFNPNVTSSKGAQGLMQIMPGMQPRLGVNNPFDPAQSVDGAAKNLEWLLGTFNGDVDKAIMGYNLNYKKVEEGKIPAETRNYLTKVKEAWGRPSAAASTSQYRSYMGPMVGGPSEPDNWKFPSNFRVGNGKQGDVFGMDKFRAKAPEIYQMMIGGAKKWQEEGGRVILRELDRKGGKPNHRNGFAADVQLIDKNGREIPNIRASGEDFRAYEKFWQDGMAYAMKWYPDADKYVRHGGYFMNDTARDSMHSDVTKKYIPGTPDPAGGNLTTGINKAMRAAYPKIVSKGIEGGDWNAYRIQQFGEGLSGARPGGYRSYGQAQPTLTMPNRADAGVGSSALIGDISGRLAELDKQMRENRLSMGRINGLSPEEVQRVSEESANRLSDDVVAAQEAGLDELRALLEANKFELENQLAKGLPTGPTDTAMREAAGLAPAVTDEQGRLALLEPLYKALRKRSREVLNAARENLAKEQANRDKAQNELDTRLAEGTIPQEDVTRAEAYISSLDNNIKAYKAAIVEFSRDMGEADRALGENRQKQQDLTGDLFGRTYTRKAYNPDGSPKIGPDGKQKQEQVKTYGELQKGFDLRAITGELTQLSYSIQNLGKNIRGFIVGAVDTFVTTIADKLVSGVMKVDTAALRQTRAELNAAIADASYEKAVKREELNRANDYLNRNPDGMDSGLAKDRRNSVNQAYQDSVAARNQALQAARDNAKGQQGPSLGDAFGALAKEGVSTLLKTAIMAPIQGIFGAFAGTKDGSSADRALWVRDVNGKGSVSDVLGGGSGTKSDGGKDTGTPGGILDGVMQKAEGFFAEIGNGFSGMFDSITGWASSAMNWISSLFGSAGGSGGGSMWGSIIGGAMSIFGFADGGHVRGPGSGTSDSIPAWLSNGEYVLTAKEVDAIGLKNIEAWKQAMKSPARFSTGGLVSTFDSTSRSMANSRHSSGTGSTDGGTVINVIDQRSAGNSEPIESKRTQGSDGKDMISIMVRDAVKSAINSGSLDRTMAANYGSRRMGGKR